tara:strand:+ start:164 stop:442 length:279 start_codon:yes stop_codon:yes gene_type:complete
MYEFQTTHVERRELCSNREILFKIFPYSAYEEKIRACQCLRLIPMGGLRLAMSWKFRFQKKNATRTAYVMIAQTSAKKRGVSVGGDDGFAEV